VNQLCIENIKKSAWYSINLNDIQQNYQGKAYNQQMGELNKQFEASCAEQGG